MKKELIYESKYLKELDGIRSFAILIIVWFHFWQQSWIMPIYKNINLDFIPRYGYLFVDMMILLSSFCLFLPYARSMIYKDKIPDTKSFYKRRFIRIVPCYLLSMIISIIFIIISAKQISLNSFLKDTITHLTFTHNLFYDTMVGTNYMEVLWTLGLEVQFYIIYPFIAKQFMKKPIITYLIMITIGIVSTIIIKNNINDYNIGLFVNNPLTFFTVYANGMLSAWLYMKFTKDKKRKIIIDIIFTILSISCLFIYKYLCSTIGNNLQLWQIDNRFVLSIVFTVFMISTILSIKYYRIIFSNFIMKFIAKISFNLYIYHQFISVKLKEFRIPFWKGDIPPNMTGDKVWQWKYLILCIIISFVVAVTMTYLVEIPITKFLKRKIMRNV